MRRGICLRARTEKPARPPRIRQNANSQRGTGFCLSAFAWHRLQPVRFAFVGAGLISARRREAPHTPRIRQSARLLKEIAFA